MAGIIESARRRRPKRTLGSPFRDFAAQGERAYRSMAVGPQASAVDRLRQMASSGRAAQPGLPRERMIGGAVSRVAPQLDPKSAAGKLAALSEQLKGKVDPQTLQKLIVQEHKFGHEAETREDVQEHEGAERQAGEKFKAGEAAKTRGVKSERLAFDEEKLSFEREKHASGVQQAQRDYELDEREVAVKEQQLQQKGETAASKQSIERWKVLLQQKAQLIKALSEGAPEEQDAQAFREQMAVLDKEIEAIRGELDSGEESGPTATNPKTGERVVFKDGKWQPV